MEAKAAARTGARTVVIGVGQSAAGDDGVGLAVIDSLRRRPAPSVRFESVSDPSGLIPLLECSPRVVIVDAVVDADTAGTVHSVRADALDTSLLERTSTHGIGVAEVLRLAEAMGLVRLEDVHVVGIAIDRPDGSRFGLSPDVEAAVSRAVAAVRSLVEA